MNAKLNYVAGQFTPRPSQISPLGNGLINDTFLVESDTDSFVLQRINSHVFPQPQQVMQNLVRLGQHIHDKPADTLRLQIPDIIQTLDGQPFFQDGEHELWRALELISPAESRECIQNDDEAAQVGFALAHFHRLCRDLPLEQLHDTLPGFHIAPGYFQSYQAILDQPLQVVLDAELAHCQAFIQTHQHQIDRLEQGKINGDLHEYLIHGDPKLNNFLFQPNTNRIISLIDLDTVKPGLLHYDIGDCVRSCCHEKNSNAFNLDRCRIILSSYLHEIGDIFTARDYEYLYTAIWLIPFELGLRFLSDYLSGNPYFKVNEPRQNLKRARAQLDFCQQIMQQQDHLQDCIEELKPRSLKFSHQV